jgi:hypothetical protein
VSSEEADVSRRTLLAADLTIAGAMLALGTFAAVVAEL